MKKKYLFITILFCFLNKTVAQDFQWVGQINGIEDETETADFIEVDNNGNSYTLGKSYSIGYDIDPTQSGIQLINNQNSLVSNPEDIYLTKLNSTGDFVWGRTLSTLKDDESVLGLKFDSQGNIYVLAFITELYQNQTLINGYGFINVIKIDPNGNEIYRRKFQNIGNINSGKLYAISSFDIDSSDNIYITGAFQNTVVLDSNPQNNLVANGNSMYVLKLNQNGAIVWVKNLNYNISGAVSLTTDTNDTVNLLFNCFNVTNTGDLLNILKLDSSNGTPIWLQTIENAFFARVTMDSSNNFAILGSAANSIPVDIDPNPNVSNMIQDKSFILFLDANANYYDSKLFDLNISMSAIEIDNLNNYHIGGAFKENNVDFDPSANTYYMSATGFGSVGHDIFYLKLNSNRDFVQAFKIGSIDVYNGSTICWGSAVSAIKTLNENIYIAGGFSGTCDLDPGSATSYFLDSININIINSDGYILKLGNCDTLAPEGDNNQIFCSSQNPTINNLSPNAVVIKWYDSATSTNQLSNITPLINGQTYYASKQIGSCPESQRLTVTVTINQTPPPPISTNQSFCENENATISNLIVTGQNVNWYSSLTNTNTLPTNTALLNNTNYYATQTVNGCESNRAIVNVTINSASQPSIISPQTFCVQQNATINSIAITGQNIKWYDAIIGGNLLPNSANLVNGQTYFASQTNSNCESLRASVLINIQNTPLPKGTAIQTFCSTQNPMLNDIVVNGTNLNWYNTNSSINTIPNTTLLVDGTTYYVSQIINNCESVDRLAITINLINTLNANDYSETICDNLNDGYEIINLTDYNANLISNLSSCTFKYYSSSSGAINQRNSDIISTISNYNLTTGNHTVFVRITSTNGCHQIVKLNTSLVSNPIIHINDVLPICENKNIIIDAGLGFDNYTWSTGSTSQSITISQAGNYSVTITKKYGNTICSSTKNFTVVLSNVATITNIETQDWTDNENIITVNTSSNSYGNYEFSIDGINYQNSNVFSGLISGAYTVYVRDKNGCGVTEDEIFLLMYPKFFTPNSDGYNDTWAIKFSYIEPKLNVKIFDRYGKLLKTLNNTNSWDGEYNGYELPSSDYWFVVTRENGKEYRGHFTLKR